MTVTDLLDMYIESGTIVEIYFNNSHVNYHGSINDIKDTLQYIWYREFIITVKGECLCITINDDIREKHKE